MADIHEVREKARAFATEHVAELAREINDWQDTGLLVDGRLRNLAEMVRVFGADHAALQMAENMANRAARDALSSPGAAQTREGAPEALTDELVLKSYHDAFRRMPAGTVHQNLLRFAAHLRAALNASQPVDGVQGGEG